MLAATALAGCHGPVARSLDKGPSCEDTTTVIAATDVPALGFSAADALSQLAGPFASPFDWTGSETDTELTVEVRWEDGEVRYLDSELDGDAEGMDPDEATCTDRIEIDAWLAFVTADGVFNEALKTSLFVSAVDSATFTYDFSSSPVVGTFDVWDYAESGVEYQTLGAELAGVVSPTASAGALTLKGTGWEDPDCTSDGCVAWESRGTAATWGEPE